MTAVEHERHEHEHVVVVEVEQNVRHIRRPFDVFSQNSNDKPGWSFESLFESRDAPLNWKMVRRCSELLYSEYYLRLNAMDLSD